jgi:hypothetical protein
MRMSPVIFKFWRHSHFFDFNLKKMMKRGLIYSLVLFAAFACTDGNNNGDNDNTFFSFSSSRVNNVYSGLDYHGVNSEPEIKLFFNDAVDRKSVESSVSLTDDNSNIKALNISYQNSDSTLILQPVTELSYITKYSLSASTGLKSSGGKSLHSSVSLSITTAIDSTDKFDTITDDSLLTLVQKRTFAYFWDFGHPVSGMARERNTSGDIVTTGGTGFGIMAIPVAVERGFISRSDGLARVTEIVGFLMNTAKKFHGAFSHWMNGSTGEVVPFAANDNGADIVETSYMMMGLLTTRQYFNGTGTVETTLRENINTLWNNVEWDWYRKDGSQMLYWNWSPDYGWAVNVPVRGWNECLIAYVLAASSTTHSIPASVYENGFAINGEIKNNNTYYGYVLPLGKAYGGPLFFEHYSFVGINPTKLSDQYADYHVQTVNHTLINYKYCIADPEKYYGYSNSCWGLTASDIKDGYTASSPTNDVGVIAPTAAISSIPYTPYESMQALRFFYYKLGDKIWGQYGFNDAFDLNDPWFADSYIAIDQGPQIVMIENYRTGLVWDLFMSCPEVQAGLTKLNFSY